MVFIDLIKQIIPAITLVGNILLFFLIYLAFSKQSKTYSNKLLLSSAWIVSLIALLGSLFYSNILSYSLCELCWYQRVFMYSLVFIIGIALLKKDYKIYKYVIPLSTMGGLLSLYHYISQLMTRQGICLADGGCFQNFTLYFGYITISFMALTAFALIIAFNYLVYKNQRENKK